MRARVGRAIPWPSGEGGESVGLGVRLRAWCRGPARSHAVVGGVAKLAGEGAAFSHGVGRGLA